jgi:hypothetical protein
MNFNPLTQFLSNNQKGIIAGVFALAAAIVAAIIAGVFLLISVSMSKDTPASVVNNYNTYNTYNIAKEAATAPRIAPEYKAPQPHKQPRKQRPKPVVKPLPRPSCPCGDSAKTGANFVLAFSERVTYLPQ